MRLRSALLLVMLLVLPLLAQDPSPEPDEDNDAKKIIGTWQFKSATKEGEKAPDEEVKGMRMKFTKDQVFVFKSGSDSEPAVTYKLNPKTKPRSLDIILPQKTEQVVKGIYKIEKDQLTICFSKNSGDRPKTFDEKGRTLIVMKKGPDEKVPERMKPEKKISEKKENK